MATDFDFLYSEVFDISERLKMLRKEAVTNVSNSFVPKEDLYKFYHLLESVSLELEGLFTFSDLMICGYHPEV